MIKTTIQPLPDGRWEMVVHRDGRIMKRLGVFADHATAREALLKW